MGDGTLILIAGYVLLILYLSARLWIAEHDRDLLQERVAVVPVDYGSGVVFLLAFLVTIVLLGIGIVWLWLADVM